jgi:hypothetical protein
MKRRFLANRQETAGTSEEGEKVEKVDTAFGSAGGNDAHGFSGLGLAAWTW